MVLISLVGVTLLSACAADGANTTPEVEEAVKLTPYHTATLTLTSTLTPEGLPTSTPAPTATATQRVYQVQANDTLIGIANYFGLTLDELLAANPGVQPALLAIGTQLIIPAVVVQSVTETAAAPLAYAVTLRTPDCALSITGGYHCFALAVNGEDFALENLVAEITLSDAAGEQKLTRQLPLPLNQLPAGASLPFYTYFAPPLFTDPQVSAIILTATKARVEEGKFFPLEITKAEVSIATDGASAVVAGKARVAQSDLKISELTLAAVAYDTEGRVIGLRRTSQESGWSDNGDIEFSIVVFSTGGLIDRVELFGEAE